MLVNARMGSNICINAHPVGCAAQVIAQINLIREPHYA